jgi:hypothetical protein
MFMALVTAPQGPNCAIFAIHKILQSVHTYTLFVSKRIEAYGITLFLGLNDPRASRVRVPHAPAAYPIGIHRAICSAADGRLIRDSETVSLELLSRLSARSKCPTILSWWAEDDKKGDILQRFGVPAFFLRLDYTTRCIDQACACMLHVASPDLYRKCANILFVCILIP